MCIILPSPTLHAAIGIRDKFPDSNSVGVSNNIWNGTGVSEGSWKVDTEEKLARYDYGDKY